MAMATQRLLGRLSFCGPPRLIPTRPTRLTHASPVPIIPYDMTSIRRLLPSFLPHARVAVAWPESQPSHLCFASHFLASSSPQLHLSRSRSAEMQTRTVQVGHISDLASEREIQEFFSFSGDIESVEIQNGSGDSRTAFVTFKDPKALEIALLLSGATIVDRVVTITPAENYVPQTTERMLVEQSFSANPLDSSPSDLETKNSPSRSGQIYVSKAQEVVTSIMAKGSAIGQDAVNKAKAFDEKHQLRANASAKVISFDRRVGLTEKLTIGISVVNEKVKSVDQKLHVTDKTMAVLTVAERRLNDTGSAVKTNRYVSAGTSWLNGAFSKVARAGQVAGVKTKEKFQLAVSNLTAKEMPREVY